ncbi:hypothetical protein CYCD_00440 [Tenuifilaceae bacterium CYCD]|nr:hypothetical protein CYCD_00440 [Tenuifilaceae bacterium CYCD]
MRKQKTGGRKKGVPNKTTEELRSMVQLFLEQHWETLHSDFEKLQPSQRVMFLEKLLTHVLPKPITDLSQLSESDLELLIEKLKKQNDEQAK